MIVAAQCSGLAIPHSLQGLRHGPMSTVAAVSRRKYISTEEPRYFCGSLGFSLAGRPPISDLFEMFLESLENFLSLSVGDFTLDFTQSKMNDIVMV